MQALLDRRLPHVHDSPLSTTLPPHIHSHLHGLKNIVVSHPGASLARPLLARLGPDLVEAGNDERAPAIKQVVKSGQNWFYVSKSGPK